MNPAALTYKPFRFSKKAKAIIASLVTLSGTAVPTSLTIGGIALHSYLQRSQNCGIDVDNMIKQVLEAGANGKLDPGLAANWVNSLLQFKREYC